MANDFEVEGWPTPNDVEEYRKELGRGPLPGAE
jgi:hypothetical protein